MDIKAKTDLLLEVLRALPGPAEDVKQVDITKDNDYIYLNWRSVRFRISLKGKVDEFYTDNVWKADVPSAMLEKILQLQKRLHND